MTRDDPSFAERFIALVGDRRRDRDDRTKFTRIPDKYGGTTLAAVTRRQESQPEHPGELLVRTRDLQDLRPLLAVYGMVDPERPERIELVPELNEEVVRLPAGRLDPIGLAHLAANLRRQGVQISANYMTPMGGFIKTVATPELTVGPPPEWPKAEPATSETSPVSVRVVIIDTGVYGRRDDGWLADLQTKDPDNLEDLDVFRPRDYLDFAAGHGSFCAGIVQQIVPKAKIVVTKTLDSDGFAHELRVARELVEQVRLGLQAEQNVIVNLSFGTETADDERPVALSVALEIIEEESRQAGLETLVVAAAGNFGHDRPCYPAAFPSVTAVAALTQGMLPAEWSSRGAWVDVSTIGEGVLSTFVPGTESPVMDYEFERFEDNAWALWSGTSFAAPQVAGAIAKIAIDRNMLLTEAKAFLLKDASEVPLYGKRVEILPHI